MPRIRVNGAELHYEQRGAGDETIVFAHGLLWSGRMFEPQVRRLAERYRCITFDFRGQGRSEVTRGGYDMETLTEDAAALIGAVGAAPCHFVGLSMGGFVGMRLALRYPALLRSLVLLDTSADAEPRENVPRYRALGLVARWLGMRLVAGPVMKIMFGEPFLRDPGRRAEREALRRQLLGNDRVGSTRAVRAVVDRAGVHDQLQRIRHPTLVAVGERDVATVPDKARRIHGRIAGSELVVIPRAGHTATLEEPEAVTEAIVDFLQRRAG